METIEQAKDILGEEFTFFFGVIDAQLQRLQLDPSARVLEVGTGSGNAAISLALSGFSVLTGEPADDDSEYAKQAWRERAEQVGAERAITYQPFDAAAMPFPDDAFPAVFMMGALHHMQDPAKAVSECIRVLAPGGVVCILEPNERLLEAARERYPNHPDATDPTPFVKGVALETIHDEMFDVYLIRDA